jgi:hypothetical protein
MRHMARLYWQANRGLAAIQQRIVPRGTDFVDFAYFKKLGTAFRPLGYYVASCGHTFGKHFKKVPRTLDTLEVVYYGYGRLR